jgi:hypothetical protein
MLAKRKRKILKLYAGGIIFASTKPISSYLNSPAPTGEFLFKPTTKIFFQTEKTKSEICTDVDKRSEKFPYSSLY